MGVESIALSTCTLVCAPCMAIEAFHAEPAVPGSPQQRPHAAVHAAAANIPSSPVPSTVRVAQQTLRKRDYESELLDRLLNSAQQAAAPAQGEPLWETNTSPARSVHTIYSGGNVLGLISAVALADQHQRTAGSRLMRCCVSKRRRLALDPVM